MVRETRLAWNDFNDRTPLPNWPLDEADEGHESPLEPPPKRRCSKRHRNLTPELPSRTDPAKTPVLNNPPASSESRTVG